MSKPGPTMDRLAEIAKDAIEQAMAHVKTCWDVSPNDEAELLFKQAYYGLGCAHSAVQVGHCMSGNDSLPTSTEYFEDDEEGEEEE